VIRIVEVGPRDGLQNEAIPIPTEIKLQFIRDLISSGIVEIEATSFVSPKWVPQLADAAELWQGLPANGRFSALIPNLKGLERALELGVNHIAVFTAASDAFTLKNINMTVEASLAVFAEVVSQFRAQSPAGTVRAYVSTAFECPYSGKIAPGTVAKVVEKLDKILGVDEVSIGDTIGVASPKEVRTLTPLLLDILDAQKIAYHFHDTRGTAVANVAAALEQGIKTFDASAGGLGGCPYAPGAGGNLATEDLVYFLEREGEPTGVELQSLSRASLPIFQLLGRSPTAKAQLAALAANSN